ncbi:MAG: response regulator [Verrucomicrobia bacterium]|nr:response regulator [Verrucomicrobiota bacterium]
MTNSDKPNRATVLVADDIAANRNLLRETLEPHGCEVLLVDNGDTALKIAKRALPDLVLLDNQHAGARRLPDLPAAWIT